MPLTPPSARARPSPRRIAERTAACSAVTVVALVAWAGAASPPQDATPAASPERRAVAFLAAEVPRWRQEHACYSCHNNGDGARALFAAHRAGLTVGRALDDTRAWLAQPDEWDGNQSDGGFDDKGLATIQFALSLEAAVDAGLADPAALPRAAALVAASQKPDGSWRLNSAQNLGTPVTYGTALATWAARRVLQRAGPLEIDAVGRADRWLRAFQAENIVDSAAVALALADATDQAAVAARNRALALLESGQGPDGGWGPFTTARSEPFDTALAVLALRAQPASAARRAALASARRFLIATQLEDGSWPETTRPSGGESYAQRMSTAGWATLALLATADR
jgi:hypothetical protein